MGGIYGTYVDKFSDGNIASCVDISTNADYPHFFFDIVATDGKTVTLRSHNGGEEFTFTICRKKKPRPREFAIIGQVSSYETIFKGGKPTAFEIYPMKGKRAY